MRRIATVLLGAVALLAALTVPASAVPVPVELQVEGPLVNNLHLPAL
ncbi:hypothetical protein [Streptomyces sp. 7N604]